MNRSFYNMILNYSSADSENYNPTNNAVVDFIQANVTPFKVTFCSIIIIILV